MRQIKKIRVGDEVFEQMKNCILSGAWKAGERIPGELELCEMMGVSRVSIREAIHRLVGMGALTIKRGEGTYLSEFMQENAFDTLFPYLLVESVDFKEVLEFRRILDLEGVVLATQRATEKDIEEFRRLAQKLRETVGNDAEFAKADLQFHTAIAFTSKNKLLIKVTGILYEILQKTMTQSIKVIGYDAGIYYHTAIAEAIAAHDCERARALMVSHYDNMQRQAEEISCSISTR